MNAASAAGSRGVENFSSAFAEVEADPAALDEFWHDMALGDFGGMYFFVCRNCPDTPYTHRYDC
jgi:hypothetical protein